MAKKHYTTEQVIMKLREIEVMTGQGSNVTLACRQAGMTLTEKGNLAFLDLFSAGIGRIGH